MAISHNMQHKSDHHVQSNSQSNPQRVSLILLLVNILFLVATIVLFIQSPPSIDMYNNYDYVDVILSKAFVVTLILYLMSMVLMILNIVRLFKRPKSEAVLQRALHKSIGLILLRVSTFLLFLFVTFYLLGYLGFYETLNINFVMPFRIYHLPF